MGLTDGFREVLKHLVPDPVKRALSNHYSRKFERNVFRPCTPNLLPAVAASLMHARDEGTLSGSGYYEFGVYGGFTLWFAERFTGTAFQEDTRFFGFDSFEGLPELEGIDTGGEFEEGQYAMPKDRVEDKLDRYQADFDRIDLFTGFFSEDFFDELKDDVEFPPASVVVVDCDLYHSTVPVLDFTEPYLQPGTVLLFDDWNSFEARDDRGERRAFREFLDDRPSLDVREELEFGWHGQSFVVTSV